ncbi:molybdenum cofactor biosynthesis protein MoaE [Nafulsella turpanensis]|uniref:molybdenum cofactor biosynthesis protein MoaE n=1 Tax=Nafulsella turpanensis TaxID=1265690 RepID=UPI000348AD1A|nr:molybdenum cofactor biosynthesis protein MoaE [Nafulsella turpanensis]
MKEKKKRNSFREGAIPAAFIGEAIAKHSSKTEIGAHSIFLGQVRNDIIEGKEVKAIEYTAYAEMAEEAIYTIREDAFSKYQLTCMHIYHSLGRVATGEICLFVFTSSKHRRDAIDACNEIVERIKKEVPVWGKELFEDDTSVWKVNT